MGQFAQKICIGVQNSKLGAEWEQRRKAPGILLPGVKFIYVLLIISNLGTKHAGFLPLTEVTDDPSVKPEEMFKVGDEIEVFVVRVNDQEGVCQVSRKKLEGMKVWDDMAAWCEEKVTVIGPDEYMGDIMGDITKRRGRILSMDAVGVKKCIVAEVPAAEMHKYATDLRSMTQSRGEYRSRFERYEEAPMDVQKRIIDARAAENK